FSSQVVSRTHMEIFEDGGKVFIKDIGSNSGTFLNGVRLSNPGTVSEPVQVHSGDYIQLGKDYVPE
ncbi:SMAD/FHA domain-containing protein, partial [Blyttiomyces helicus]